MSAHPLKIFSGYLAFENRPVSTLQEDNGCIAAKFESIWTLQGATNVPMNVSKRLTHHMTVSPIAFRRNLRFSTAPAHAQAPKGSARPACLASLLPPCYRVLSLLGVIDLLVRVCEATGASLLAPKNMGGQCRLQGLRFTGLAVRCRVVNGFSANFFNSQAAKAGIDSGIGYPCRSREIINETVRPSLCNAVSFHDC